MLECVDSALASRHLFATRTPCASALLVKEGKMLSARAMREYVKSLVYEVSSDRDWIAWSGRIMGVSLLANDFLHW